MDNASVCDSMARAVAVFLKQKYDISFRPENSRIRCMAHILNLVVQAFLSGLGDAEDPDQNDYYYLHKHDSIHVTAEELEELASTEPEPHGMMQVDLEEVGDNDE